MVFNLSAFSFNFYTLIYSFIPIASFCSFYFIDRTYVHKLRICLLNRGFFYGFSLNSNDATVTIKKWSLYSEWTHSVSWLFWETKMPKKLNSFQLWNAKKCNFWEPKMRLTDWVSDHENTTTVSISLIYNEIQTMAFVNTNPMYTDLQE